MGWEQGRGTLFVLTLGTEFALSSCRGNELLGTETKKILPMVAWTHRNISSSTRQAVIYVTSARILMQMAL